MRCRVSNRMDPNRTTPVPPLSVLDLVPVGAGSTAAAALSASVDPRPGGRAPRLPPGLGRGAPQHAGDRELVSAGAHRAPRGGDRDDPHRCGRRDAAEPRRTRGRRAVRDAGGAPSRSYRSRHRPRARDRSGHGRCAAPGPGLARRRRVPRAVARPVPVLRRRAPADHRGARPRLPARGLDARLERLQRARCRARSGFRSRSRTTSRRTTRSPRSRSTATRSGRRPSSQRRTR